MPLAAIRSVIIKNKVGIHTLPSFIYKLVMNIVLGSCPLRLSDNYSGTVRPALIILAACVNVTIRLKVWLPMVTRVVEAI